MFAKYEEQGTLILGKAWYYGTTDLKRGTGVCYNRSYGTATEWDGLRDNVVAVPTAANAKRFAGVLTDDYAANSSNGVMVTFAKPGSVIDIAVAINTTVNSTYLTCSFNSADAGRFHAAGLMGRGSALALQTSTTNQLEACLTGVAVISSNGKTLTDSTPSAFVVNKVVAGDIVVLLGINDNGTNYGIDADAVALTDGQTTAKVATTPTSATVLTLDHAVTNGGSMTCSYYIIHGNPTIPALLLDGVESGLCQHRMYTTDGSGDETFTQVGGKFWILGGYTSTGSHTAVTLGSGAYIGQLFAFECLGAITTDGGAYKVVITDNATGIRRDGSTALASVGFDAVAERATLIWGGTSWDALTLNGATEA